MATYLLFDSNCSVCTTIGHEVERATSGWLTARSLRDPVVHSLLDKARPGWRWEPTILEVTDHRMRVFTGLAMRMHLLMSLGPYRTLHLARLIGRLNGMRNAEASSLERRRFLQQLGTASLLIGFPQFWPSRENGAGLHPREIKEPALADQILAEGEIYSGFVLLSDGAAVPSFVRSALAPILGSVDNRHDPMSMSKVTWFDNFEDLKRSVSLPLWVPDPIPAQMKLLPSPIIQFAMSGDVYMVTLNLGQRPDEPQISLWAQPTFPQPFPVWPVRHPSATSETLAPVKVSFTPSPGVMRRTFAGHMINWIAQGILYTLIVEHDASSEAAKAISKSLIHL